jgi:hypothetical protein
MSVHWCATNLFVYHIDLSGWPCLCSLELWLPKSWKLQSNLHCKVGQQKAMSYLPCLQNMCNWCCFDSLWDVQQCSVRWIDGVIIWQSDTQGGKGLGLVMAWPIDQQKVTCTSWINYGSFMMVLKGWSTPVFKHFAIIFKWRPYQSFIVCLRTTHVVALRWHRACDPPRGNYNSDLCDSWRTYIHGTSNSYPKEG